MKTGEDFSPRTQKNVFDQINKLKEFYAQDLSNYNAVFLGQHDALGASPELLEFAASYAYEIFEFDRSNLKGAHLFLFGSVDSLLSSEDTLFELLNDLPFLTYINIGLESADAATLAMLKKPITIEIVTKAFARMLEVNRRYEKIEVTANILLGSNLPQGHLPGSLDVIRNGVGRFYSKGAIYFSPLMNGGSMRGETRRTMLRRFGEIKSLSLLPTYLYLIQRL